MRGKNLVLGVVDNDASARAAEIQADLNSSAVIEDGSVHMLMGRQLLANTPLIVHEPEHIYRIKGVGHGGQIAEVLSASSRSSAAMKPSGVRRETESA